MVMHKRRCVPVIQMLLIAHRQHAPTWQGETHSSLHYPDLLHTYVARCSAAGCATAFAVWWGSLLVTVEGSITQGQTDFKSVRSQTDFANTGLSAVLTCLGGHRTPSE